jgi:hypothetical protein
VRKLLLALASFALAGVCFAQPAAALDTRCRETLYGDGAKQARVCFTYWVLSDGTWSLIDLTVWNIPLAQGGHTDSITPYIRYFNGRQESSNQAAVDGGSYYNQTSLNMTTSQSNTIWMDYAVYYGPWPAHYCKRVFVTPGGGTSAQNITCPT